MNEDNITPALNLSKEIHNEMSAEEFQRKLYAWFEERGLLSELRAHLRVQMISVLKDTTIGRTVSNQSKQAVSPKLQALNMLIAEFLLYQDYHYSLSVFSTEVPLINVLPEISHHILSGVKNKKHEDKKWQFVEKDLWDILETLGIKPDSQEAKCIFSVYYQLDNKESLLTCIVRMIPTIQSNSQLNIQNTITLDNQEIPGPSKNVASSEDIDNNNQNSLDNILKMLISANLGNQNITQIIETFKTTLQIEKQRVRQEEREKYLKLKAELDQEAISKEAEYVSKIQLLQKSFENDHIKMLDDFNSKQSKLDGFAQTLQHQNAVLRDRYEKLVAHNHSSTEQEKRLTDREQEVERKERKLHAEFKELRTEQANLTEKRSKINTDIQEKDNTTYHDCKLFEELHDQCEALKVHLSQTREFVSSTVLSDGKKAASKEQQTTQHVKDEAFEETLLKRHFQQLQLENTNLRHLSQEQHARIRELSSRAGALMYELENCHTTINMLTSSSRHHLSNIITSPPLLAPPVVSVRQRTIANSFNGGGEEGIRVIPTPSPRAYRNLQTTRERRRAPPRRLTIHSSSSDEPSPTETVLHEARQRLRQLEQESIEVDRNYQVFRTNHSLNNNSTGAGALRIFEQNGQRSPVEFHGFHVFRDSYSNVTNMQRDGNRHNATGQRPDSFSRSFFDNWRTRREYRRDLSRHQTHMVSDNQPEPDSDAAYVTNLMKKDLEKTFPRKDNNNTNPLDQPGPSLVDESPPRCIAVDLQNFLIEQAENRTSGAQSGASSGLLNEMLAGTSGVSFSGVEMSSAKSDSSLNLEENDKKD